MNSKSNGVNRSCGVNGSYGVSNEKAIIAEDNFACEIQARLYHQNEWLKISKENEILKEKLIISANSDKRTIKIIKALDEIKRYTINQFCDDCEDIGSTELASHCEFCEYNGILDIINKAKEQ